MLLAVECKWPTDVFCEGKNVLPGLADKLINSLRKGLFFFCVGALQTLMKHGDTGLHLLGGDAAEAGNVSVLKALFK